MANREDPENGIKLRGSNICTITCKNIAHIYQIEQKSIEATSDITVMVDCEPFKCHRFILMSHSLLLRDIIMKNMQKKSLKIAIPKIRAPIFQLIYTWMYTCSLEFKRTDLPELLTAAKQLKIPVLIEECSKLASKDGEVKYLLTDHKLALELGLGKEIGKSTRRIAENFRDTVHSSHFVDFTDKGIRWLMAMDDIYIGSETEVFDAVFQWIKHRWLERSNFAVDLFSYVRFALMTDKELLNCLLNRRYRAIMSIPQIREMILKAMLSHIVMENNIPGYSDLIPPARLSLNNLPEKKVPSKELFASCVPLYGPNIQSTQAPLSMSAPMPCISKSSPFSSPKSLSPESLLPCAESPIEIIASDSCCVVTATAEPKKKDSKKKLSSIKFSQMVDLGDRISQFATKMKMPPKITLPAAASGSDSSSIAADEEVDLIQKYTKRKLSLLKECGIQETEKDQPKEMGELEQFALPKSQHKKIKCTASDEDVGKIDLQDIVGRPKLDSAAKNNFKQK